MQCVVTQGKLWIMAPWTGSSRQESNLTKSPREKSTTTIVSHFEYIVAIDTWIARQPLPFPSGLASSSTLAVGCGFCLVKPSAVNSGTELPHRTFLARIRFIERNDALWSRHLGRSKDQVICCLVWQWLRVHESTVAVCHCSTQKAPA
jgi:hypothetical protein